MSTSRAYSENGPGSVRLHPAEMTCRPSATRASARASVGVRSTGYCPHRENVAEVDEGHVGGETA